MLTVERFDNVVHWPAVPYSRAFCLQGLQGQLRTILRVATLSGGNVGRAVIKCYVDASVFICIRLELIGTDVPCMAEHVHVQRFDRWDGDGTRGR